jgi:hypothetical protein
MQFYRNLNALYQRTTSDIVLIIYFNSKFKNYVLYLTSMQIIMCIGQTILIDAGKEVGLEVNREN